MPWLHFHFGNILLGSAYTLQLAEFGGLYLLTFSLVFFNALITAVVKKQFPLTYLGIYLGLFLLINVGVYLYRSAAPKGRKVKLNLLTENIDPRLKWEEDGNAVVNKLLNLSKQAAQNPAAINIWTETVVPWTYRANDDFLDVILRHTQQNNALTLLGMNTEIGKNEVYDSAYLLTPTAEVLGRYDKNYPLAVIESESSILPRGHNRGTTVVKSNDAIPIVTPQGKIGVLICNEVTVPYLANRLVAQDASFLVNMSNDGWFAQSFIPKQHFYYSRLRAVETRRDVVVNSNMGYRGVFTSNGDEVVYQPMGVAALEQVTVHQKTGLTLYTYFPWLMLIVSIILIIIHKYNYK